MTLSQEKNELAIKHDDNTDFVLSSVLPGIDAIHHEAGIQSIVQLLFLHLAEAVIPVPLGGTQTFRSATLSSPDDPQSSRTSHISPCAVSCLIGMLVEAEDRSCLRLRPSRVHMSLTVLLQSFGVDLVTVLSGMEGCPVAAVLTRNPLLVKKQRTCT